MLHLLDTDTLTLLHRNHPRVVQRLRELPAADRVGTTIITRIELLRGRFDAVLKAPSGTEIQRAQDQLIETEARLTQLEVVPFDVTAASVFDRLRGTKGLTKIGRADLLIASMTLAHQAVLVTRNLRHFRPVPNLKVTNWVD